MSRRPFISADDSLELLLDTICNTFATVIFISMLASIMAQKSATSTASADQTAQAIEETFARQRELSGLQQRQEVLQQQLAQQAELLQRFASTESVDLAMQIHQDSESQAKLASQKTKTAESIVLTEREKLLLEQNLRQLLEQVEAEQRSQQQTENNLRDLQTKNGHTAEVRRVHETSKFGFTFALDNGRLYSVHTSEDPNSDMMNLMLNRDECEIVEIAGKTTIKPQPAAGLLLRGSVSAKNDARVKLNLVSKKYVVRLFVARDSFSEFLPVKEALTELGLEYALEIMAGDDVELFLSDKVQSRTFVQ